MNIEKLLEGFRQRDKILSEGKGFSIFILQHFIYINTI